MTDIIIRSAAYEDMKQIINFCQLHAEYEGQVYEKEGKLAKLELAIFNEKPELWCFVAVFKGDMVGYATATKEFSTWDAGYFLHMDCLYLLESTRGLGVGAKLIRAIADLCKQLLCSHVQWQTPSDNHRAVGFYEKCGATSKDKKRFFLDIEDKL